MSSLKRKTLETPPAHLQSSKKSQKGDQNGKDQPIRLDEPVACLHDVSYPENYFQSCPHPQPSTEKPKPAKEFPFELDPFQSEAIKCLDNGESVMVSLLLCTTKFIFVQYCHINVVCCVRRPVHC